MFFKSSPTVIGTQKGSEYESTPLNFIGYHGFGIVLSYIVGYALASLTTFTTILGRIRPGHRIDSCCSVLELQSNNGFASNFILTFRNFASDISRLFYLFNYSDFKGIIKTSIIILITAEGACILTAKTGDLIFQTICFDIEYTRFIGRFFHYSCNRSVQENKIISKFPFVEFQ